MMLLLLILGGFIGWGLVFYHLDRPSVPAWKVRDAYRVVNLILMLLMIVFFYKALTYHAELVQAIKSCR